ncbi:hypothetical protein ACS0TY_024064 [Phlomoides rotata]
MTIHVNAQGGIGEKGKVTRGRRFWSKVEEDTLIQCLTDIVNDGWKTDNGFKAGFQRELEKGIRKLLPGTYILANPHINSKIHVYKKEYNALYDLLSRSGIGWNSTTSMIEVDDESVWDASKRADPQLKGIHFKTWPYYGRWLEIFGKDRATGKNVVDPTNAMNEMSCAIELEHEGETGDKCMPSPLEKLTEIGGESVSNPFAAGIKCGPKCQKKKRLIQI